MKFVRTHIPCPCGKSSDAYAENEDGSGKCYSCDKFFKGDNYSLADDGSFTYEYLESRGVQANVMRKFNVQTKINAKGEPVALGYPYGSDAMKVRELPKKFFAVGDMSKAHLFGKDVFEGGQATITIFEGEHDALAGYQILNTPCVSVRGASSALADCRNEYEYLNSFGRIYICFDNDGPGKEATQKVASLFDNSKVFHVKLTKHKDCNDYLLNGDANEFKQTWYNSKRFLPDNIISSYSEIKSILGEKSKEAIATYPFERLQEMSYGIRTGECVLIKAMEGIGKTEILRAMEFHTLKETDYNIGIIHLEERKDRTIQGLAGYYLGQPVHLPDSAASVDDIFEAFKSLTKRDERVHIYSHFGSDDPDVILSSIRFLVSVCGCKLIYLDHISMLVSGTEQNDERQRLDYISTRFKMLAEELDFAMIFISHVNDNGDTRGSRNISKIADLVIKLDRDKLAPTEIERNTTYLTVEKNRFGSMTGPAGKLIFDRSTFMIRDEELTDGLIPGTT